MKKFLWAAGMMASAVNAMETSQEMEKTAAAIMGVAEASTSVQISLPGAGVAKKAKKKKKKSAKKNVTQAPILNIDRGFSWADQWHEQSGRPVTESDIFSGNCNDFIQKEYSAFRHKTSAENREKLSKVAEKMHFFIDYYEEGEFEKSSKKRGHPPINKSVLKRDSLLNFLGFLASTSDSFKIPFLSQGHKSAHELLVSVLIELSSRFILKNTEVCKNDFKMYEGYMNLYEKLAFLKGPQTLAWMLDIISCTLDAFNFIMQAPVWKMQCAQQALELLLGKSAHRGFGIYEQKIKKMLDRARTCISDLQFDPQFSLCRSMEKWPMYMDDSIQAVTNGPGTSFLDFITHVNAKIQSHNSAYLEFLKKKYDKSFWEYFHLYFDEFEKACHQFSDIPNEQTFQHLQKKSSGLAAASKGSGLVFECDYAYAVLYDPEIQQECWQTKEWWREKFTYAWGVDKYLKDLNWEDVSNMLCPHTQPVLVAQTMPLRSLGQSSVTQDERSQQVQSLSGAMAGLSLLTTSALASNAGGAGSEQPSFSASRVSDQQ